MFYGRIKRHAILRSSPQASDIKRLHKKATVNKAQRCAEDTVEKNYVYSYNWDNPVRETVFRSSR